MDALLEDLDCKEAAESARHRQHEYFLSDTTESPSPCTSKTAMCTDTEIGGKGDTPAYSSMDLNSASTQSCFELSESPSYIEELSMHSTEMEKKKPTKPRRPKHQ